MVPIGSLAYMRGKTIHTNEILIHLGEQWFAEKSCKEAMDVIERRRKGNFVCIVLGYIFIIYLNCYTYYLALFVNDCDYSYLHWYTYMWYIYIIPYKLQKANMYTVGNVDIDGLLSY